MLCCLHAERKRRWLFMSLLITITILTNTSPFAVAQDTAESLVVYSGRSEGLIGPILEQFTAETGIQIEVRYGQTAEMAATILEEGANSPTDVYIAQDAGALGALAAAGRLLPLSSDILERVPLAFQSAEGLWVGISGRARVLAYNTELVGEEDLPVSILDLTGEAWTNKVGWAPTNGSFQASITAMRVLLGDDATRDWLIAMADSGAGMYENNRAVLQAVIDGEVAVGIINHYYLYPYLDQDPELSVALHHFASGDPGALVNVAGAGVVNTTDKPGLAQRLLLYLLGNNAQRYFSESTYEYPLVAGIAADPRLLPEIDLSTLDDLQATLELLLDANVLQ